MRVIRMQKAWVGMLFISLVLLACLFPIVDARAESIAYSFTDDTGGGIAAVEIDATEGKLIGSEVLLHDRECHQPLKVRRGQDGTYLTVTNLIPNGPHLYVKQAGTDSHSAVILPSLPDEVRIVGDAAWVSCAEDQLVVVDLKGPAIERIIQVDETFMPQANAPEGITVVDEGNETYVVVSFQKDSKTGKKKGNRLAIFRHSDRQRLADLPLPRDHPELHIEGNLKEQGPGPEIIFVQPQLDTLLITLDLYGAIGFADWQAAKKGQLRNWTLVSTAEDGSLGRSFPDRAAVINIGSRTSYLVCNAGVDGGSTLVDVRHRNVLWRRKTPPGLESPVFDQQLRKAYSVCSGKIKRRTAQEVEKLFDPRPGLFVFDFSSAEAVRNAPVDVIDIKRYAFGIVHITPASTPTTSYLLVAAGSTAQHADQLLLIDPASGNVLDQHQAAGPIGRLEGK